MRQVGDLNKTKKEKRLGEATFWVIDVFARSGSIDYYFDIPLSVWVVKQVYIQVFVICSIVITLGPQAQARAHKHAARMMAQAPQIPRIQSRRDSSRVLKNESTLQG